MRTCQLDSNNCFVSLMCIAVLILTAAFVRSPIAIVGEKEVIVSIKKATIGWLIVASERKE